jgi:hypothetical protein
MLSKTRVPAALIAAVATVLVFVLPSGGTYWP